MTFELVLFQDLRDLCANYIMLKMKYYRSTLSYIDIFFTLWFISVHESNDKLSSHSHSSTIPPDVASGGHALPVGSNNSDSGSHDEILLTGNVFTITRRYRCSCIKMK